MTKNWISEIKQGLSQTRKNLGKHLSNLLGGGKIDEVFYEELEATLLTADAGVSATTWLLDTLRKKAIQDNLTDAVQLREALQGALFTLLTPLTRSLNTDKEKPFIIMLAGVNGAGKTTSIGKLAHYFQSQGKSVLLAAGDTFRAAAREQLIAWGKRNNVPVIAQDSSQKNGDSSSIIFDAINAAKARNIDIVLADTAGRLPTQLHLMEEIKKVKRVIAKAKQGAPHEVLLVLDANIGQNTINQVEAFDDALKITGLMLTKLDGTAKGGVIAAIAKMRQENILPLYFIGTGENIDDLKPFDAREFVETLFD